MNSIIDRKTHTRTYKRMAKFNHNCYNYNQTRNQSIMQRATCIKGLLWLHRRLTYKKLHQFVLKNVFAMKVVEESFRQLLQKVWCLWRKQIFVYIDEDFAIN